MKPLTTSYFARSMQICNNGLLGIQMSLATTMNANCERPHSLKLIFTMSFAFGAWIVVFLFLYHHLLFWIFLGLCFTIFCFHHLLFWRPFLLLYHHYYLVGCTHPQRCLAIPPCCLRQGQALSLQEGSHHCWYLPSLTRWFWSLTPVIHHG